MIENFLLYFQHQDQKTKKNHVQAMKVTKFPGKQGISAITTASTLKIIYIKKLLFDDTILYENL